MTGAFRGRHRTLLFRAYLFLVVGLLSVAAVLDLGFGYLQSSQVSDESRWLESSFRLIEEQLAGLPAEERTAAAIALGRKIDLGVLLLDADDLVLPETSGNASQTLLAEDGSTYYLRNAASLNTHIRLGPIEPQHESAFLRLLPPIFYISIFFVVGLWLRPLFRDLNLITDAMHRFAADYRKPISTAGDTTQLTGLAKNLDEMSGRLSGLIQSQKELIAALSHEMRTPLARIRFALAVLDNNNNATLNNQLEGLNNDVQEIDRLIATMLNYARLDHPDLRMNWQQVPLEPWLSRLEEKYRQPGKELKIVRDEALNSAWMDPRLMSLAVGNLLTNAGRYAEATVQCTVSSSDSGYRIQVEDDGRGIPEPDRETIFKAFTRLDDSRNRDTGGYGLGLAIVARIASLHSGRIDVLGSERLGGALFVLGWERQQS